MNIITPKVRTDHHLCDLVLKRLSQRKCNYSGNQTSVSYTRNERKETAKERKREIMRPVHSWDSFRYLEIAHMNAVNGVWFVEGCLTV